MAHIASQQGGRQGRTDQHPSDTDPGDPVGGKQQQPPAAPHDPMDTIIHTAEHSAQQVQQRQHLDTAAEGEHWSGTPTPSNHSFANHPVSPVLARGDASFPDANDGIKAPPPGGDMDVESHDDVDDDGTEDDWATPSEAFSDPEQYCRIAADEAKVLASGNKEQLDWENLGSGFTTSSAASTNSRRGSITTKAAKIDIIGVAGESPGQPTDLDKLQAQKAKPEDLKVVVTSWMLGLLPRSEKKTTPIPKKMSLKEANERLIDLSLYGGKDETVQVYLEEPHLTSGKKNTKEKPNGTGMEEAINIQPHGDPLVWDAKKDVTRDPTMERRLREAESIVLGLEATACERGLGGLKLEPGQVETKIHILWSLEMKDRYFPHRLSKTRPTDKWDSYSKDKQRRWKKKNHWLRVHSSNPREQEPWEGAKFALAQIVALFGSMRERFMLGDVLLSDIRNLDIDVDGDCEWLTTVPDDGDDVSTTASAPTAGGSDQESANKENANKREYRRMATFSVIHEKTTEAFKALVKATDPQETGVFPVSGNAPWNVLDIDLLVVKLSDKSKKQAEESSAGPAEGLAPAPSVAAGAPAATPGSQQAQTDKLKQATQNAAPIRVGVSHPTAQVGGMKQPHVGNALRPPFNPMGTKKPMGGQAFMPGSGPLGGQPPLPNNAAGATRATALSANTPAFVPQVQQPPAPPTPAPTTQYFVAGAQRNPPSTAPNKNWANPRGAEVSAMGTHQVHHQDPMRQPSYPGPGRKTMMNQPQHQHQFQHHQHQTQVLSQPSQHPPAVPSFLGPIPAGPPRPVSNAMPLLPPVEGSAPIAATGPVPIPTTGSAVPSLGSFSSPTSTANWSIGPDGSSQSTAQGSIPRSASTGSVGGVFRNPGSPPPSSGPQELNVVPPTPLGLHQRK